MANQHYSVVRACELSLGAQTGAFSPEREDFRLKIGFFKFRHKNPNQNPPKQSRGHSKQR